MVLQLDGGNTIIGTEFIKLEITGSSNLATESYVNTAIINGGGGGGADLPNYYNKTETNAFLNQRQIHYWMTNLISTTRRICEAL